MNIQEALQYIEKHNGETNTYNGHSEWEVRRVMNDPDEEGPMYEVHCYEPEMIGGVVTEHIQWIDGFTNQVGIPWYDRTPDFKQAVLTERQVIMLAMDLKEVDDDDDHELWEDDFDSAVSDGTPPFRE